MISTNYHTGVVQYLILIDGRIIGVTEQPTLQLMQQHYGTFNFPTQQYVDLLLAEGFTSTTGQRWSSQAVNWIK